MAWELACTGKLLKEFGSRKQSLAPPSLDGLNVWYADLFYQSGRKCVLLRNPETGLSGLYPFVNRE